MVERESKPLFERTPRLSDWLVFGVCVALVLGGIRLGGTDRNPTELLGLWILGLNWRGIREMVPHGRVLAFFDVLMIACVGIGLAEVVGKQGFLPSLLIYCGVITAIAFIPFEPLGRTSAATAGPSDTLAAPSSAKREPVAPSERAGKSTGGAGEAGSPSR